MIYYQKRRACVTNHTDEDNTFTLGWAGYRIVMTPVAVLNNYGDGWIGRETDLWLSDDILPTTVILSGRSFLPETVAYPIHLEVWLGHSLLKRFTIEGAGDFTLPFQIERTSERHQDVLQLKLVADKTTIPSRDSGLPDTRELSIIINTVEVIWK